MLLVTQQCILVSGGAELHSCIRTVDYLDDMLVIIAAAQPVGILATLSKEEEHLLN